MKNEKVLHVKINVNKEAKSETLFKEPEKAVNTALAVFCLPEEKTILKHVLNPVIAMMSSKLLAAISKVGMPFLMPYPPSCKRSMEGTTTAGETAPSTKLIERL